MVVRRFFLGFPLLDVPSISEGLVGRFRAREAAYNRNLPIAAPTVLGTPGRIDDSAKQVGPAIFFSLVTIVVSFLPVFLLGPRRSPSGFSSILAITLVPVRTPFAALAKRVAIDQANRVQEHEHLGGRYRAWSRASNEPPPTHRGRASYRDLRLFPGTLGIEGWV